MPWQVFYKMYRPPSPPSSNISQTVKPEFPKYLLQISLKPRPPDSVLKLDSLVPRDIKIHPCNVKMWNAAPVTRKIQILRPNSPLSTLHATSGSQNQKSQKEETIAKNTTQKITNITWISDIPNSPLSLLCVTSGSQNLANHLTPSSLPDSHLHLSGKTWMDGSTHFIKIGIGCLFHKQKGPKGVVTSFMTNQKF